MKKSHYKKIMRKQTYWVSDEPDKQREWNKSREIRRKTRIQLKKEIKQNLEGYEDEKL